MFLVFGCNEEKEALHTGVDSTAPVEMISGMLSSSPSWTSTEWGYSTGGAFADINKDGLMDLVVAEGNDMAVGYVRVYLNRNGSLESTASWVSAIPHFYGHLAVGDVNGDNWVDVVVSRYIGDSGFSEPGGVEVFLNNSGELSLHPDWEVDGLYSFSSALGDIDLDGDLDIGVAVGEAYYGDAAASVVFENDGAGQFELMWQTGRTGYAYDVGWADMNSDGWLDLLLANQDIPHAIYFNQNGTLSSLPDWEASGSGFEGNTLDFGDVNADGHLDLLVSDNNQMGGAGVVRIWCGPDFFMCWESLDPPDMQSAVSFRDVDLDNDLDVIAGSWWGPVRIYRNEGGILATVPDWFSDIDDMVVEAFCWADLDCSHCEEYEISGHGLVSLPDRGFVVSVEGGVAQDGYISGSQVSAIVRRSTAEDLLVTDWESNHGNWLFPFE